MADSILSAWWDRIRGRLRPRPCPYSLAHALEMPGRRLVAAPERIMTSFGIDGGQVVVEIGCGTGFYSVEAARRVGPSGLLLCVDLQLQMLRHARGRVAASGLSAGFVQANARVLPLRDGSVHHVFLIGVLGELPDQAAALAEVKRVLRTGGRLSISEQLPDPDFVTLRRLRRDLTASGFVEERSKGFLWYTSTWSKRDRI